MAHNKVPQSRADSQAFGLIHYLSEASQDAHDNFQLRQLGSAAEFRRELSRLLDQWVIARAQQVVNDWTKAYVAHQPSRAPAPKEVPPSEPPANVTALDPFFRPRAESNAIRRAQNESDRNQWIVYYARWGCVVCNRKDAAYSANGMCGGCFNRILMRLRRLKLKGEVGRLFAAGR